MNLLFDRLLEFREHEKHNITTLALETLEDYRGYDCNVVTEEDVLNDYLEILTKRTLDIDNFDLHNLLWDYEWKEGVEKNNYKGTDKYLIGLNEDGSHLDFKVEVLLCEDLIDRVLNYIMQQKYEIKEV